jgi:hypothetical protein
MRPLTRRDSIAECTNLLSPPTVHKLNQVSLTNLLATVTQGGNTGVHAPPAAGGRPVSTLWRCQALPGVRSLRELLGLERSKTFVARMRSHVQPYSDGVDIEIGADVYGMLDLPPYIPVRSDITNKRKCAPSAWKGDSKWGAFQHELLCVFLEAQVTLFFIVYYNVFASITSKLSHYKHDAGLETEEHISIVFRRTTDTSTFTWFDEGVRYNSLEVDEKWMVVERMRLLKTRLEATGGDITVMPSNAPGLLPTSSLPNLCGAAMLLRLILLTQLDDATCNDFVSSHFPMGQHTVEADAKLESLLVNVWNHVVATHSESTKAFERFTSSFWGSRYTCVQCHLAYLGPTDPLYCCDGQFAAKEVECGYAIHHQCLPEKPEPMWAVGGGGAVFCPFCGPAQARMTALIKVHTRQARRADIFASALSSIQEPMKAATTTIGLYIPRACFHTGARNTPYNTDLDEVQRAVNAQLTHLRLGTEKWYFVIPQVTPAGTFDRTTITGMDIMRPSLETRYAYSVSYPKPPWLHGSSSWHCLWVMVDIDTSVAIVIEPTSKSFVEEEKFTQTVLSSDCFSSIPPNVRIYGVFGNSTDKVGGDCFAASTCMLATLVILGSKRSEFLGCPDNRASVLIIGSRKRYIPYLRPTTYDLRPTTYDLRPTTYDLRPTTYDLRPTRHRARGGKA